MPQTHPTAPATGLVPVPVAVLLPPPGADGAESAVRDLPHWHGVTARDAAGLITRLSTVGDLVVELDGHPTIIRAAEHLGRRPAAALPGDLGGLSAVMQTWRAGLRPGGYLLTALTTAGCDQGGIEDPATYRAGVIAAARTAGLTWQQEFLVLTAPPPEDEPRAMPGTPLDLPSALVDGKHLRVHVKVLAFRNNTGGGNG